MADVRPPSENDDNVYQPPQGELLDISANVVAGSEVKPTSPIRFPFDEDEPQLLIEAEDGQELPLTMAMNAAMGDLIDDVIKKAEASLRVNLNKQKLLEERKQLFNREAAMVKRKVPVTQFLPPYFKDHFNMCPPQNAEAKAKFDIMIYDPLLKEEKKWHPNELRQLHSAVRQSMLDQRLMPIYGQRDLVMDKIREANATTTAEERKEWNEKLEEFERKIDYAKNLKDAALFTGDYSKVDWARIAMDNFKGQRTPTSLRLRWCNEQAPQWSKKEWTAAEVKKLYELASSDKFISWSLVAAKLDTQRTAWQCFEKYKSEIANAISKREWSQEEDARLVELVESLRLNGRIQWDRVTYHMTGRTRQQCRTRFLRTLDTSIRHGKWTNEEDLLLLCSIGRYGAKDWQKVAKGVPGRSDGQCRERWVNVLDRGNQSQEWTMDEDDSLLHAVNLHGKGQWDKISSLLPGRSANVCQARFRSMMTTKMRICAAQISHGHKLTAGRGDGQPRMVVRRAVVKRSTPGGTGAKRGRPRKTPKKDEPNEDEEEAPMEQDMAVEREEETKKVKEEVEEHEEEQEQPAAPSTPDRTVLAKHAATPAKRAATPAKKDTVRGKRTATPKKTTTPATPRKAAAATPRKGKGEGKLQTPANEGGKAGDGEEKEIKKEEEEENEPAALPTSARTARAKKVATPVKKATTPATPRKTPAKRDVKEDEGLLQTPAKKGRSTLNSMASDFAVEGLIGEEKKEEDKEVPKKGRGRSRKSEAAVEKEVKEEETAEDQGETGEEQEKEDTVPPKGDTVPAMKDSVPPMGDTVPATEKEEDTVAVEGEAAEAVEKVEGTVGDTVGEP